MASENLTRLVAGAGDGGRPCERRAEGKSIVSFVVLMLRRPGQQKKTEGFQYQKDQKAVIRVSYFVKTSELALACAARMVCISHHTTVEARDTTARTSLRLLAVLNVLSSTPARAKRLAPRPDGPLTHFASPRGEKCRFIQESLTFGKTVPVAFFPGHFL